MSLEESSVDSSSVTKKERSKKTRKKAFDDALDVPVLQIGDEVPNFTCDSTVGMFTFHDIIDGNFAVLVSFPANMDPVGTTEIGMLSKLREEFEARGVRLIALGVENKQEHRKWIEEIEVMPYLSG